MILTRILRIVDLHQWLFAATVVLAVCCAGCQTLGGAKSIQSVDAGESLPAASDSEADRSGAPGAVVAREESVRPGINDTYRDADVETWVQRFESESREIFHERHRIVEAVGLEPGMDVADVGAGTGLFTGLFAQAVGPVGKVYAVDISQAFLKHIRDRVADRGLDNVETVLCAEDSVDLAAESVDVIFICDTYHHFEYPKSTMRSILRALRPGGRLVVIDFRRVEGGSRQWVLDHVRAGQGLTTVEIVLQGFELLDSVPDMDFLQENYFLRFRKPD